MHVQNDTSQIPFTLFPGGLHSQNFLPGLPCCYFLVELVKSNILMQLEHIWYKVETHCEQTWWD